MSYGLGMSPRDWLENLPSALRHELSLSQLIESGPDLGPVTGGLESQLGVSIAIHDLIEADRSKAHLCRRVQPAVLTGRVLERLRVAEATAAERVALVALQSRLVART